VRVVLLALSLCSVLYRPCPAASPASRGEAVSLYQSMYLGSAGTSSGWTGNVASCTAGDVSGAYRAAGVERTDYFRIMAGLPGGTGLNATWNAKCQEAALMMSANAVLSHSPPASWQCYSADGAEAAGASNLAGGYATLALAITGWMRDNGIPSAGHRRWILYPRLTTIGLGATFGNSYNAYSMWVIGLVGTRPPAPEWVAWPPATWVPYDLAFSLWSLSYNGTADFTGASVTMTRNGSPVAVTLHSVQNGFGDNTLTWTVAGLPSGPPTSDVVYHVAVSGIVVGGLTQTHEYDVTVIDPSSGVPVLPTTWGGLKSRFTSDAAEGTAP
jgi:hypothetical protein